jgi:hypothetical protein
MPHRQFKDHGDVVWEVWDVHPVEVARRMTGSSAADEHSARRTRMSVARELASGWLCFESSYGKRRLSPIPGDWDRLSDAELSALCERATNAPSRRTGT